ncbi:uncharacterized protein LOC119432476 [Dermacentor silvarum]|uniref:uncharacterized protein LOC119432476 n=1 Tax=Dermacentor silvarum TaxID=543639 RepID=UPI00189A49CA|nr:uncharacterized protein LOC119432476 [Dermacentor silvarum]
MSSAQKDQSATGRGAAQAQASSNDYRIVLPRLPTGKLVTDSVFLHADLTGRPYRAQDFRDALRKIIDLREIISIGQFQMSHVWMVTCKSPSAKARLVTCGEFLVKSKRCVVIDPEPAEVKIKMLWLPEHLEDAYIREALQTFGKVLSISKESWKVSDMEEMRTLNRDVVLSLADGVSVADIPHLRTVCGIQSLLLIPGRPPLCLRCHKVGHIRRHCRTPRCDDCRRFGHTTADCVVTYADKLRHRTRPSDDALQEHIMDVTEVLDATGDLPADTSEVPPPVSAEACETASTEITTAQSEPVEEATKKSQEPETVEAVSGELAKEDIPVAETTTAQLPNQCPTPMENTLSNNTLLKRRASTTSVSSEENSTPNASRQLRRRRSPKHKERHRRSRSRRPGVGGGEESPSSSAPDLTQH